MRQQTSRARVVACDRHIGITPYYKESPYIGGIVIVSNDVTTATIILHMFPRCSQLDCKYQIINMVH